MSIKTGSGNLTPQDISDQVSGLVQEDDEQVNFITFINTSLNRINIDAGTNFPLITIKDWDKDYEPIDAPWTDIIVDYCCYLIKRANDLPYDIYLQDYKDLLNSFIQYGIKDEYKTGNFNQGRIAKGSYKDSFWNEGNKNENEVINEEWELMIDRK